MEKSRFLYIHLPFCDVVCHYCDFYKVRAARADHPRLTNAILKHLELLEPTLETKLAGIYFGGGTPSTTPLVELKNIMTRLRNRVDSDTEITLEANPSHIIDENLIRWKELGVNRISMGIQSLNDKILHRLGRVHKGKLARDSVEKCLKVFNNVTGDLIYAVPEQDLDEPARDAETFVKLGLNHVSCYHLTLKSTHFLYPRLPSDQFARDQLKLIADRLQPLDLEQYEIASFSKKGFESRNNQNYLVGGAYAALGPSASGFDGNLHRWKNITEWTLYCEALEKNIPPLEESENLTLDQRRIEQLFTSLRTRHGLDLSLYHKRFGKNILETHGTFIQRWQDSGLCVLCEDRLVLTFDGKMLADELIKQLL